ncbi:DUF2249 domain-containing protein [uncultured Paracoccus sp.]|uniref:DUF2249 domain-containing protein n=1 Tax=uncultured Paracoccus sp. TaxID=189685 RepID=UPI002611441E|nr:DUF2249 domain-containing protein [uncultured Paracoccus sp.]
MSSAVTIDVRPMLATGKEPFAAIMQAAESLPAQHTLRLIAPFRLVPLLAVMEKRGFTWEERQLGGEDWQVDFSRAAGALAAGSSLDAADWPVPVRLLDVTGLEPPEPMTRILAALEAVAPGEVVFALLDRQPLFLLPLLQARGHRWVGNHAADGSGYRLLVRRGNR